MPDADRPLTDTQVRALIALHDLPDAGTTGPEGEGWHRANEIFAPPRERFSEPTWWALRRYGCVEAHESSTRQLELRITAAGRAMLASMGD